MQRNDNISDLEKCCKISNHLTASNCMNPRRDSRERASERKKDCTISRHRWWQLRSCGRSNIFWHSRWLLPLPRCSTELWDPKIWFLVLFRFISCVFRGTLNIVNIWTSPSNWSFESALIQTKTDPFSFLEAGNIQAESYGARTVA